MTGAKEESLERVPCLHYPVWSKNTYETHVQALVHSGSEVNAINLFFTKQLGLAIKSTDIETQKIDGIMLNTYGIVVVAFLVVHKANQARFFEKNFLVANISPEVIFERSFFTLSSADIDFLGQ